MSRAVLAVSICTALSLSACASASPSSEAPRDAALAGSTWRLVQFQSSDDAIGRVKPDDPAKYEMTLGAEGGLSMRLDCNRGAGRWTSTPTSPGRGTISLGPVATTRALCPPGSLDTQLARDSGRVRSYVIEGDSLHLALEADGGIYTWRRTSP